MAEKFSEKDVECPFTWELSLDVDKITWNLNEVEEFIPEVTFMRFLTLAYVETVKKEYDKAEEKFLEAEAVIKEIKSEEKKEVARHIFNGTKIHFLIRKENLEEETDELLKDINNINDKIYLSFINEFKACFWTNCNYCTETINIAIKFAKIAIEHDPNDAIAHYLLARNLRTARRAVTIFSAPKKDEMFHFRKAYELDKNPKFTLFFAQSLKENKNYPEAMKIFNELHDMNLQNVSIQLRLALAFIQNHNLNEAKKCLDFIESVKPNESMFLHYKGLYLMKKKEYKEAAEYLLRSATEDNNYRAEMCYIRCIKLSKQTFDFTSYLLKIYEKYSDCEDARKKEILLHIGFSYFYNEKDYQESLKYFLQAFEIQEESMLRNFSCKFVDNPVMNVYRFLMENLLPKIKSDETTEKLMNKCKPHLPYRPPGFSKTQGVQRKYGK